MNHTDLLHHLSLLMRHLLLLMRHLLLLMRHLSPLVLQMMQHQMRTLSPQRCHVMTPKALSHPMHCGVLLTVLLTLMTKEELMT